MGFKSAFKGLMVWFL